MKKKNESEYMSKAKLGEPRLVKDCLVCDSTVILMAQRDNTLMPDNNTVISPICDKCREKYLNEGTMLLNPENGDLLIIRDEAFSDLFDQKPPKGKIIYTEQVVINTLNENYKKMQDDVKDSQGD